jgi:glycosyltransferase 2 family protein
VSEPSPTPAAAGAPGGETGGRRWRLALSLLVTLALLGLLVREFAGTREFFATITGARSDLVLLAVALSAASVLTSALRWQQVLGAMGYPLSFGRALHAVLAAWPVSVFTPSRAGDFARSLLVRDKVPVFAGAGSVLVEKAVDIHTLLCAALLASAGHGLWAQAGLIFATIAAEWAIVFGILRGKQRLLKLAFLAKRAEKIEQLYLGFEALASRPTQILWISASSLVVRLLTVGMVAVLLAAAHAQARFSELVAPWLLATLAGLLPFTIGGMGTRDAAFAVLLESTAGVSLSEAAVLAATMGYSLIAILSPGLIGLPLLARSGWLGRSQPSVEH